MNTAIPVRAFYGQYRHSVDEKGRVSVPADFRPLLMGERGGCFLNRGFEGCIMAYPEGKWGRVLELVNARPLDDENTRWFKRAFFSGAKEVSPDQQGRILLPPFLKEYAGITRDVMIVGMSDYVEIWDADTWEASIKEHMPEYGKSAEKMVQSVVGGKAPPDGASEGAEK
jgi:MraZ protein